MSSFAAKQALRPRRVCVKGCAGRYQTSVPLTKSGKMGNGMRIHGEGMRVHGEGFFSDLAKGAKKAFNKTKRFITSKPVKNVIRTIRKNVVNPAVKHLLPQATNALFTAANMTPLAPLTSIVQPFVQPKINVLAQKGADALSEKIDKTGYGMTVHGGKLRKKKKENTIAAPLKDDKFVNLTAKQRAAKAKTNSVLDGHSLRLLHNIIQSSH